MCGSNNCLDSLGFNSEFDCCYAPTLGDEHFCASGISCGENEGDCDSDDECQDGLSYWLLCNIYNSCAASLGLVSEVNCCYLRVECANNIFAASCEDCGAKHQYIYEIDSVTSGQLCSGPHCRWNVDLEECQPKGM